MMMTVTVTVKIEADNGSSVDLTVEREVAARVPNSPTTWALFAQEATGEAAGYNYHDLSRMFGVDSAEFQKMPNRAWMPT